DRHHVARRRGEVGRAGVAEPAAYDAVLDVDDLAGAEREVVGGVVDDDVARGRRERDALLPGREQVVGDIRRDQEQVAEHRRYRAVGVGPGREGGGKHAVAHRVRQHVDVLETGLLG